MSGLVSGITKTFQAVGSAVARVGKAVTGVGATTFTAGAASAAPSMATGGLSGIVSKFTGGGVLGNIITGAVTQAGYGALMGGAVGALTGNGFGKGAMMGGLGGAVVGGLSGAAGVNLDPLSKGQPDQSGVAPAQGTATGTAPTGQTSSADMPSNRVAQAHGDITGSVSSAAAPAAAAASGGGFGKFLSSEAGGGLIAGVGKGLGAYMDAKQREDEAQKDRKFLRDKEQRLQDSYSVDPSALHGPAPVDTTARPTPAQAYGRTRYEYSPEQGRIIQVPA